MDFSSTPSRRKPITVAHGTLDGQVLTLARVDCLPAMVDFEALLQQAGPWLGAFDFPFGLPRVFVESLALGRTLPEVTSALKLRCANRMQFRALVDAWGNARPKGQRLVHRRTDTAEPGATTTSPLQTRYVPVGFMFFEGVPRLLDAGVTLPGLAPGDNQRVAIEGYPGLLASELVGQRSYKNSDAPDRREARADILRALTLGRTRLGLSLRLSAAWRRAVLDDASGDLLDAVMCLVQAAWSWRQAGYGLPPWMDPLEGWVATARWPLGLHASVPADAPTDGP